MSKHSGWDILKTMLFMGAGIANGFSYGSGGNDALYYLVLILVGAGVFSGIKQYDAINKMFKETNGKQQ